MAFDVKKLIAEASAQEKAQLEIAAVLQAALSNPMETTIYNTCAIGWAPQDDGSAVLMVGLLGGRQLRLALSDKAVADLHAATAPSEPSSSDADSSAPSSPPSTEPGSSDEPQEPGENGAT